MCKTPPAALRRLECQELANFLAVIDLVYALHVHLRLRQMLLEQVVHSVCCLASHDHQRASRCEVPKDAV